MEENELGALIRRVRKERGLSGRWLAKKIGVNASSLSRFERGGRNLGPKKIARVMSYLKIGYRVSEDITNASIEIRCKRCLHRQIIKL